MTFPNKLTRHSKEEKHLLRFTYQQIIYLVCTTTKSRETERDSQPDTFEKKKRESASKIRVVPKPNSLVKVWVNVSVFKFLGFGFFHSLEFSLVQFLQV